jgi:hypothetical protein
MTRQAEVEPLLAIALALSNRSIYRWAAFLGRCSAKRRTHNPLVLGSSPSGSTSLFGHRFSIFNGDSPALASFPCRLLKNSVFGYFGR